MLVWPNYILEWNLRWKNQRSSDLEGDDKKQSKNLIKHKNQEMVFPPMMEKILKNLQRDAQTSLQRNPNQWWSPGEPCSDHFHTTRDVLLHLDKNISSFQDISKRQTKGTSGRPERNLVILELLIQKWVPSVTYNKSLEPMIKPSLSLSKKQRSSSDTILYTTLVTQYSNICSQVEYNWDGIQCLSMWGFIDLYSMHYVI